MHTINEVHTLIVIKFRLPEITAWSDEDNFFWKWNDTALQWPAVQGSQGQPALCPVPSPWRAGVCMRSLWTSDYNVVVRDCWEMSVFCLTPGHRPLQLLFQRVVSNRDEPLVIITLRPGVPPPVHFLEVSSRQLTFWCDSDTRILRDAKERLISQWDLSELKRSMPLKPYLFFYCYYYFFNSLPAADHRFSQVPSDPRVPYTQLFFIILSPTIYFYYYY